MMRMCDQCNVSMLMYYFVSVSSDPRGMLSTPCLLHGVSYKAHDKVAFQAFLQNLAISNGCMVMVQIAHVKCFTFLHKIS